MFPSFYEKNVLTNYTYLSIFILITWVPVEWDCLFGLILFLTISYFVFILPFTKKVLMLVTMNELAYVGDHFKSYPPGYV